MPGTKIVPVVMGSQDFESADALMKAIVSAVKKLNKMCKNSSRVRLRNRCMITGRCRGYIRKFGMSRICFREAALDGIIPGVTKSSW